jgi:STE24 endopeptidase
MNVPALPVVSRSGPLVWRQSGAVHRLALLMLLVLGLVALLPLGVHAADTAAAPPAIRPVDDAWRAALPLDPDRATRAYLDRLSPEAVARSNAYFEGGYWLRLWNWLLGVAVAVLLLFTRPSSALRDALARRLPRWPFLRRLLYGMAYLAAVWVLTLPLAVYQEFFREHAYGMATQSFGAWAGEALIELALFVAIGGLAIALLYTLLAKVGRHWWWSAALGAIGFATIGAMLAPVYIQPLFNTYKPVPEGPVKQAVLTMARANGVPANDVLVFDASRQTTRVSANVAGLGATAAIRLNDNLLDKTSLPEIRAVMAHEIGHYALNHVPKSLLFFTVVFVVLFGLARFAMKAMLGRFGTAWRIDRRQGDGGVGDVASLPLLAAVVSTLMLLATPVFNTQSRTRETEADLWGLNLAREPHGMAEVLLKLVEYRKPEPGYWEEVIFYTHPSAKTRIHNAMRWRAAQVPAGTAAP